MEQITPFETFAILAFATGIAESFNARFLKLPFAMGLVVLSLLTVGVAWGLSLLGVPSIAAIDAVLPSESALKAVLIDSSLALMLFAAARSLDRERLRRHLIPILLFATVGVVLSTIIVAFGTWGVGVWLGFDITLPVALLFGAIIAPTDALAVRPIADRVPGERTWKTILEGESLFNDAMALLLVVVFGKMAMGSTVAGGDTLLMEFAKEAGIAVLIGAGVAVVVVGVGWLTKGRSRLGGLLLSIGAATCSYTLAMRMDASGPVSVVTAGILMMELTKRADFVDAGEELQIFWSQIEKVLAALFFFLIGLEVIVIETTGWLMVALAVFSWVLVLLARFATVGVGYVMSSVIYKVGRARDFIIPMSLAGVRGAISIALALSLPDFTHRNGIVVMTFGAVVIGLIVQGGLLIVAAKRLGRAVETGLHVRPGLVSMGRRMIGRSNNVE